MEVKTVTPYLLEVKVTRSSWGRGEGGGMLELLIFV